MSKDNKTKDYIAPISLAAKDLIDIKAKSLEQTLTNKQDDVGIFELVDMAYKKDYPKRLHAFVDRVKKVREGDFFVEVLSYQDPLLNLLVVKNNVIKMIDRKSCPTPRPGHHVYHYIKKTGDLELVWVLPDQYHIQVIKDNIIDLASDLKDLIDNIYKYEDGRLMQLSDKLNGIDPSKPKDNRIIKLNDLAIDTDTKLKDNKKKDINERYN